MSLLINKIRLKRRSLFDSEKPIPSKSYHYSHKLWVIVGPLDAFLFVLLYALYGSSNFLGLGLGGERKLLLMMVTSA